ncbi:MAG: phosphatase PAP2 family protein [Phycisphaeraceae bacterium]|nr:phosphatase PAP2 family protein [Phycisphaeraceae bacterium]
MTDLTTSSGHVLKPVVILLALLAGLLLCLWADRPVYHLSMMHDSSDKDWHRMFRVCGFLPTWLIVGAGLWLVETAGRHRRGAPMPAGLLLVINVMTNALVVEGLKLLIRRERPNLHDGLYFFRPFHDKSWSSGGFGMPSSHAMIAFAAAWMLCRLYPRAWPVWMLAGFGCAFVRVGNHSHFISDVYVAIILSFFLTGLVWRCFVQAAASAPRETSSHA